MLQHISTRNILISSAVTVALALSATAAFGQNADAPTVPVTGSTPDIETSKITMFGEVNTEGTLVRSGPSENDYQVMKLAKGTRVTAVGMRFDWLKIVPPEGAFCLVPQAFIDKLGDEKTGRVINKGASVRIGSTLTQAMHRVLPTKLEPGQTVTILGATLQDEFYKIAPPRDAFLYIDKKFVTPLQRADTPGVATNRPTAPAPDAGSANPTAAGAAETANTVQPTPGTPTPQPAGATPTDDRTFTVKSPLPAEGAGAVANAEETANTIRALQEKLSKLEDKYAAIGQGQDANPQPLVELGKEYDALIADNKLPPNARKVAEYRASQIKMRQTALTEMASAKKTQEEAAQKQRDLKAEQEELAARVAAVQVKHYAAVGRLLQSSLQVGGQPLYRLVDPATSRLIIYVRAAKVPVGDNIDKFIAVNGQVVQDETMRLTYVQPESIELANPKDMNTKIFADYAPPSMATANITGEASAR